MTEHEWEQLLAIDTVGEQVIFPSNTAYHRYEATPYADFETLFTNFTPLPHAEFVDFGCGKGRMSFFVAHKGYPATGIEMDGYLFQVACANQATFTTKFPDTSVDFHCDLAQNYQVKQSENSFYFFNPFDKRIFQQVIYKILTSAQAYPRSIMIILYYPSHEYLDFLDDCTPLSLTQTIVCQRHDPRHRFMIYTNI